MAPGLVEERQRDKAGPIGDHDFEDGTTLLTHGTLFGRNHLGNQRDLVPDRHSRDRRQLTPTGITPRIVLEQIPHSAIPESLLEGFLGPIAQDALQCGV